MGIDIGIITRVELAFGADLTASPLSWDWTDITKRTTAGSRTTVHDQTFSLKRGRANESARTQPSSVGFIVDNPDGALMPGHPSSPWWPHVDRGVPCRISIIRDGTRLALGGVTDANATTPHHASLEITGDFDVRIEATHSWRSLRTIAGRYRTTGDQRSWLLELTGSGQLGILWSPDGTIASRRSIRSTVPVPAGGRRAIRVTIDVDNGAGGTTVTFFTAATIAGPWEQLGDPVEDSGTTSIHAGSSDLEVGTANNGGTGIGVNGHFDGKVHAFELRDGIDGTVVTSPDFAQPAGTTAFSDSQGRSWTISGAAEITDRRERIVGQVESIRPRRPSGNIGYSEVEIHVSGVLRRLEQGEKPLDSALFRRVMDVRNRDNLIAYWPLEDGSQATQGASPLPGVAPFSPGGEFRFGTEDGLAAARTTASVAEGQPAGWTAPVPAASEGQWWLNMFVRLRDVPSSGFFPLAHVRSTGTERTWILGVTSTNFQLFAIDADGAGALLGSTPHVAADPDFNDVWLLVTLNVDQNGGNVDWDAGWVPLNRSHLAYGFSGSFAGTAGRVTAVQNLFSSSPPGGLGLGHLIIQTGLGLGWLAQAEVAFDGEAAGTRFARLCAEQGVAHTVLGDPADTELMGPQRPRTLTELLQECADIDLGIMGEARDRLALTYRTRATLHNQGPALELDHAAGEVLPPFSPAADDQRLRNDVTVSRERGSSAQVTDDDSISVSGRYDASIEVNAETDDGLEHQAAWRLHLGTWPDMRYPGVTADLAFHDNLADTWLEVTEGDLTRVTNLPPEWPPGDVDQIVEGSTENWSQWHWQPAITASPGAPWVVGVLDDNSTRLDTDGSELSAGVDTASTTLGVAITDGPEWTTDPAEAPFDIVVGGEQMTVTAVAGSAPTQLFTVVRSVNGITKAHDAGTTVRVARPFRLRL